MQKEIKAKLFALYLGQKVYYNSRLTTLEKPFEIYSGILDINSVYLNEGYLLLRSVEQLSDEEAMQIANFYWKGGSDWEVLHYSRNNQIIVRDEDSGIDVVIHTKFFSIENRDGDHVDSGTGEKLLQIADYLRSRNFALPFTTIIDGAVRTVSVEEQCNLGCIQLVK